MNEVIIFNDDIGKPKQIEEKLKSLINSDNIGSYTLEQFSQLFSGEFRGLVCYYKEKNKNSAKQPWFKEINYTSIPFSPIKIGRKTGYKITKLDLINWYKETVFPNTILITKNDYIFVLKFSIACYIKMKQAPHGLAGMDRDMNQRLSNDILGKLAEIAVMKHARKYKYDIELAFDLWNLKEKSLIDYMYEQDIRAINKKIPNKNIEIKATKYRSSMQDVPMYKTRDKEKHSFDYLIQAKLTLPKLHLLNYMNFNILGKNISDSVDYLQAYENDEKEYNKLIKEGEWKNLPVYISGFMAKEDMFKIEDNRTTIPCLNQSVKDKYFTFSALLDNSSESFESLYKSL